MSRIVRSAYRAVHRVRLFYWWLFRPVIFGVKVVVVDPACRVLLVRHSYGNDALFMLPGGGVRRGEDILSAAIREVAEETGITISAPRLHGNFVDTSRGATNHIATIVAAAAGEEPRTDGREIVEAGWFAMDKLPPNLAAPSRLRIAEVRDGRAPASTQWR